MNRRRFVVLGGLACLSPVAQSEQVKGKKSSRTNSRLQLVDSGILWANRYQGDWAINAYFPSIVEIAPHHLVCVYRRGSAMYSDDGRIYQLRSTDNGHTWQDEGCVWGGKADPQSYWYSPVGLSLTPDGELLLTGFRIHRPTPDTLTYNGKTGAALPEETLLFRSHDQGRRWSPAKVIKKPGGRYLEVTSCVVVLNDGRWLIPYDISKAYDDPTPLHAHVVGLCSKDRGRTWDELVHIAGGPEHPKTFWHARVIKLADGRLIAFPWTGDSTGQKFLSLHRVVGDPTGQHWSEPEPIGIQAQTNYPVDLGGGRMALIYSFREAAQPGEYVALSEDEGRTWDTEHAVQVWDAYGKESIGAARTATYPSSHDNIAYGAPNAVRLHDGDILASFWAGQSGQMACRWARLHVMT